MGRQLFDGSGLIDAGTPLDDSERMIRDEFLAPSLDEFVLDVRAFYARPQEVPMMPTK